MYVEKIFKYALQTAAKDKLKNSKDDTEKFFAELCLLSNSGTFLRREKSGCFCYTAYKIQFLSHYLFGNILLITHSMPGTMLDIRDSKMKQHGSRPQGAHALEIK